MTPVLIRDIICLNNELLIIKLKDTMKKILFLLSLLSIGSLGAVITVTNDTNNESGVTWHCTTAYPYHANLEPGENIEIKEPVVQLRVEKIRNGKESLWIITPLRSPKISIRNVINSFEPQKKPRKQKKKR